MPRLDVCLQWAVSGCVVKKWHGVPAQTTLGELVTDELDNLPGEMLIIHKSKEVMLQDELQMVTASVDTVLTFNLVRIHAYKRNIIQIMPYICLDGFTAVRMSDLGIVVTFPKAQSQILSCVTSVFFSLHFPHRIYKQIRFSDVSRLHKTKGLRADVDFAY